MSTSRNVIITCALTGAGDTVDKHPAIPVTPTQIAAAAVVGSAAGLAGATAMPLPVPGTLSVKTTFGAASGPRLFNTML